MKIFSWMQNKLISGRQQVTGKPAAVDTLVMANGNHMVGQLATNNTKEEFSDWPQSLLAIGTFGTPTPTLTQEEEEEVVSELSELQEAEDDDDKVSCDRLQSSSGIMLCRAGKDKLLLDQNYVDNIRKKSLSFLLKKIFTSSRNKSSSSSRPASLNHHVSLVTDSCLPDPTSFDKSRMEKILRALLNKKIHPQTTTFSNTQSYLKAGCNIDHEQAVVVEDDHNHDQGSTWVKTDSEYIVLEI